ncbi:uncharacterized protein LOC124929972 [Impatiens glandulifera]|uniref:uncharacterized protein LOC124929972 n=1 Tax=Impatiens glandulifera TaxID=253017 RepID=UPI001FB14C8C|nr:uncharacterized protein LOC124929972 [Impatiens glandulifera]
MHRRMSSRSNIQRFLRSVTPTVPCKSVPRSCIQGLNKTWFPGNKETVEYFELSDLWNVFDEWSAYGAGTSIVLGDGSDNIIQYFAPFLSGIQIYTDNSALSYRYI